MTFTAQKFIQSRWPWLAASILLTVGLFVTTTLGWLWYVDQRDSAERVLSLDLLSLERSIIQNLDENQQKLKIWSRKLQHPNSRSTIEFLSLSDGLMEENPALVAIDFVDQDGQRVMGLPTYVDRPERLPDVNDPLIIDAIQRCHDMKIPVYSRVIERFAPLWVLAVPVSDEAAEDGVVLATYDLDQLLSSQVPWWFVKRYDLSLIDRDNNQLSPRDGSVAGVISDVHKLNFGPDNSGLSLHASPRADGYSRQTLLWLSTAVIALGVLIIWLLQLLQRWLRFRQAAQEMTRQRDELLQQTARLSTLAEFATGIAHELNQPLYAVSNYSAVALAQLETQPLEMAKVRHAIQRAGEEAVRAGKIIQSVRSLIKKSPSNVARYKLIDLLTEPLLLLKPLSQRLQLGINVNVPDRDIILVCDAVMIEQVILNLIRNGLEAVAEAGCSAKTINGMHDAVTIQTGLDQDFVVVCVSDRGPGIADPDKLFQPFYTTKKEGMGMGLAICRTVIENHGGKLWAENNPAGGASFYFKLHYLKSPNEVQLIDNEVNHK